VGRESEDGAVMWIQVQRSELAYTLKHGGHVDHRDDLANLFPAEAFVHQFLEVFVAQAVGVGDDLGRELDDALVVRGQFEAGVDFRKDCRSSTPGPCPDSARSAREQGAVLRAVLADTTKTIISFRGRGRLR